MAILYLKVLLFMLAAIILFTCFLAGVILLTIGQCNRSQFTAAIKTSDSNTYAGYQIYGR